MKCCSDAKLTHFLKIYKRMTNGGLAYSVMIGANEEEVSPNIQLTNTSNLTNND